MREKIERELKQDFLDNQNLLVNSHQKEMAELNEKFQRLKMEMQFRKQFGAGVSTSTG